MAPTPCRPDLRVPRPARGRRPPVTPRPAPPPAREEVLGVVAFPTHRGEVAEAILDARGRWRCPRLPVLDRVLNILFEPGRVASSGEPLGYAELIRVAAWLKGEVRQAARSGATGRRTIRG